MDVSVFAGFTLIYGPPGTGKTSLALRLASMLGKKILYIGMYEHKEKVEAKLDYLGLNKDMFKLYDFINISEHEAVLEIIGDIYVRETPDVVVLDGVNYFPDDRETASAIYRIFDVPVLAVGEEPAGGKPLAYMADLLVEVRQEFLRGARYRYARFLKSRLGQPPASELRFAVVRGGPVLIEPWDEGKASFRPAAPLAMRRVVFVDEAVKAFAAARQDYTRPGLLEGSRVADFVGQGPEDAALAAALLCDYAESAKTALVYTNKTIERFVKCDVGRSLIPVDALSDDKGLEALMDAIGDSKVAFLYGMEQVVSRLGARRLRLVLDFLNSWRPDLAILAVFSGVEPSPRLFDMFNTVWRIEGGRAEVVKSMLGWPVKHFKVERREGAFYFVPSII
ncbi:MAG: RAD55 family ATPase [Thermoproteus sp.]